MLVYITDEQMYNIQKVDVKDIYNVCISNISSERVLVVELSNIAIRFFFVVRCLLRGPCMPR